MNLQPLRRYPQPQLPTHDAAEANPELLKLIPRRWRTNPAVLTAMIGAGLLTQCLAEEQCPPLAGVPAPPTIRVSESEARRIIIDEAKKAGITFAADKKKLNVPVRALAAAPIKGHEASTTRTTITLDGTDVKRAVSFEYVTAADANAVSKRIGGVATVRSVAEALKDESKKQLKGRMLVVTETYAYDHDEGEQDLRAQVKDFIKWLKAQGVI